MRNKTGKFIKCDFCGKPFYVISCRQNEAKYCSHKCYTEAIKLGKYPKNGFQKGNILGSRKRQSYTRKPHSEETKRKIGKGNKGKLIGEKNHQWQGGKSFETYGVDWTLTLKQSIRQRDNYTCQMCGKEPSIQVHHIDHNKKNCNSNNLITLCRSCHRTIHNKNKKDKIYG